MNRVGVIPAAGTGSRLGTPVPKAVAKVDGRPMLRHLLELYAPVLDALVVVVRPEQERAIRDALSGEDIPVHFAYQERPTGMLDALVVAGERVREWTAPEVWITWCDQVGILPATVERLVGADVARARGPDFVFPTVRQEEPYVHFVRDERDRIVDVRQRREGDPMPRSGESDVGLFGCTRRVYVEALPRYAAAAGPGRVTGDTNFLPFIPWLARSHDVRTVLATDAREAIGVNTPADLRRVERFLDATSRRRSSSATEKAR